MGNFSVRSWPTNTYKFNDEPIIYVYLAKLYCVVEVRTAYYGRTSITHKGDDAYRLSLDDAKNLVENMRRKGSQWIIDETPLIAVSGRETTFLVSQLNTPCPLRDFEVTDLACQSLESFISMVFRKYLHDSIILMTNEGSISHANLPFFTHDSVYNGSEFTLNWKASPAKRINEIVDTMCCITKTIGITG